MRIAPIIHTRTFSCDFNSEFLVKPECFMDSDIKWARKNVLGATVEIDGLQGFRWLIADNGKYRMAGVVGFLKNICSKCQLSAEENLKSEEIFCDDKGRLVYAFIGIVIDKQRNDNYGAISLEYLWKIYLNKIYPIWKRTYQEAVLEKFTDINVEPISNTVPMQHVAVGLKKYYETNVTMDYELFVYYLCNRSNSEFSFCSNICDFNMVKQSDFNIITTSQNIITRIGRGNIVKTSSGSSSQSSDVMTSLNRTEPVQKSETKKKSFLVPLLCLMIFAVIILMLLLIMD